AGGERVDHRGADAVQTAGGGVGGAAELAAGVQLGEDDLDAREAGARLDVDGDAARAVVHLDGPVLVQHDVDPVAVASQGLVHRVVDDLPQAVHEAAAVGGPDVHARALADRLQALEDLEVSCGVVGAGGHGLLAPLVVIGCTRQGNARPRRARGGARTSAGSRVFPTTR